MPEAPPTNSFWPEVAVAAVDVLGVRALVAIDDDCAAAATALGLLARNASARFVYLAKDLKSPAKAMYGLDTYFGDSVYLFGDPSESLAVQVYGLLVRVASLIAIGLSTDARVLLRGSVAVGNLRRRIVVSDGGSREIRIGTAMVRAHQLEQCQHWIGAAVAADAPLNADAQQWVLSYPVPLKRVPTSSSPALAINWVARGLTSDDIEKRVEEAVLRIGATDDAMAKMENTRAFVRHVHADNAFPPMEWPG